MSTVKHAALVDVIVIGGSAAGLSAALALGRSRRSVVVIDAGHPRNAPSAHMHGYLGHDGLPLLDFLELGRVDVARYGVVFTEATATTVVRRDDATFDVALDDGRKLASRRVLVATGLVDELPDVAGLRERWGNDVVHCPYCHGWEVQDESIAVISTGPMGVHGALLFRQWSSDITLFVHTGHPPTAEEAIELQARGIRVVEGQVVEVVVNDDRISGLRLATGEVIATRAVVVAPRMIARSEILESFGLEPVAHPLGADVGMSFEASPTGQTAVAGVWATGNVVDIFATVPSVVAAGYMAGAMLNADLIAEETALAVDAFLEKPRDEPRLPVMDEAFWDERYGSAERIWSGQPNPHLVTDIADLAPGRALDVGAGEGADAIWLAQRGWIVTAVDISTIALERGRAQAATRGPEVAERITWKHSDVVTSTFPTASFDLVSVHFMHLHTIDRIPLFQRCIAAVAPRGTLQVVGHHPSDMDTTAGRPRIPDAFYTPDEIADMLDNEWTILAREARPRPVTDHNGAPITIHDTVLVAHRAS